MTDNAVSELDLNAKIRLETLSTLASSGPATFLISIINAVIVFVTIRDIAEAMHLNLWLAAIILVSVLRSVMVVIFRRLDEDSSYLGLWSATYLGFVYASGILWGALPLSNVFFTAGWTETFIVFVVSGMSAGGLVSLYSSLKAATPYQLIMLLPLIYVLASSGAPAHTAMAILAGMYLVLLIRSTYSLNQAVSTTIRLKMENQELFQFLLKAKQ
jgi:hypothetical protein